MEKGEGRGMKRKEGVEKEEEDKGMEEEKEEKKWGGGGAMYQVRTVRIKKDVYLQMMFSHFFAV